MKIYLPWNNLGCLGFKFGRFYIDFYNRNNFGYGGVWNLPGMFISTGKSRYWITLKGIKKD